MSARRLRPLRLRRLLSLDVLLVFDSECVFVICVWVFIVVCIIGILVLCDTRYFSATLC